MDRGAWRAIVHGFARVGHVLVTKPPQWTLRLGSASVRVANFSSEKRTAIDF